MIIIIRIRCHGSVSYTHLDVYKRQAQRAERVNGSRFYHVKENCISHAYGYTRKEIPFIARVVYLCDSSITHSGRLYQNILTLLFCRSFVIFFSWATFKFCSFAEVSVVVCSVELRYLLSLEFILYFLNRIDNFVKYLIQKLK